MSEPETPENLNQIAIIGMACRFPGANTIRTFWDNLRHGVESIAFFSDHELIASGIDPAVIRRKNYVKAGSVLDAIESFDAGFFGFSPREAELLDPQQRLFMECTWEALEQAGYDPQTYAGAIGLYGGTSMSGYLLSNLYPQLDRTASVDGLQTLLGNEKDYLTTHISYKLDLKGPSIAIQTACSTSLVAVHIACQSLLASECDIALAGGVTVRVPHKAGYLYQEGGIFSPDGHCRAFDARAQGTVFGSGVGVVALKRLQEAIADRDAIHAVIRGSAINNDGSLKIGYTAPSQDGQAQAIAEALLVGNVDPATVTLIEAHGTGTPLGDPIEVAALTEVFRESTRQRGFCAIGSVKTNVGHLESAAGIAGLIKAVLALEHTQLPPSLHFATPNPAIDFAGSPFYVNTATQEWKAGKTPRRAGVSSFGMGGTNAHVVLEEAPTQLRQRRTHREPQASRAYFLPLSARSPQALQALAQSYQQLLSQPAADGALHDICYSASLRRSHHQHRAGLVGETAADVATQLAGLQISPGVAPQQRRKLAWVFSGQGAQWDGMGRQLLEREPVFRLAVEQCARALRPYVGWSLVEALQAQQDQPRLEQTDILQPVIFAIQVGLAALWRSWGIEPDAVVGHSLGEVAAAHVAGALTLDDAAQVVYHRSRLLKRVQGRGAMAVVELAPDQAQAAVADYGRRVAVGAVNSPRTTVISGDPAAIQAVMEQLRARDIFCRQVHVDIAFHSPQIDPLCADLSSSLAGLKAQAASIPIYSTVTGTYQADRAFDAAYWVQNFRQPVLFGPAIQRSIDDGYAVFLELSPHAILSPEIENTLRHQRHQGTVLRSMYRGQSDQAAMLRSLGALYRLGYSPHWAKLYPSGGQYVAVPSYPWQRERFWIEPAAEAAGAPARSASRSGAYEHPLLGSRVSLANLPQHYVWESRITLDALPYLGDHRVQGTVVLPGTAYIEMALAALDSVFGPGQHTLEQIAFKQALALPEQTARILQVMVTTQAEHTAGVEIFSRPDDPAAPGHTWSLHASALARRRGGGPQPAQPRLEELRHRCQESISSTAHYAALLAGGLEYGPGFQGIAQLWKGSAEVLGRLRLPTALAATIGDYRIHPALLDAGLQLLGAALPSQDVQERILYLPVQMERLHCYGRTSQAMWAYVRQRPIEDDGSLSGDILLYDDDGALILEGLGLRVRPFEPLTRQKPQDELAQWLYTINWRQAPLPGMPGAGAPFPTPGSWLIFADRLGVGARLGALLEGYGERCVMVFAGSDDQAAASDRYSCNPARPEDVRGLLDAIEGSAPPLRGIIHLWSLDIAPAEQTDSTALALGQALGCGSLLHLVQALARAGEGAAPRLWVLTRGSQSVEHDDSPIAVGQSPIWGLCKTISYEHPELRCSAIDLGPSGDEHELQALVALLCADGPEEQIALRGKRIAVARLASAPQAAAAGWPLAGATALHPDSTYLIGGGLGALGSLMARWMVERGARNLVLVGRHQPTEQAQQWLQALRQAGARIVIATADLADEARLAVVFAEIARELPPLRGVLHCAGVLDDGILLQQNWERFGAVMAPKVQGAWNLHRLTRDLALDFFIMFSSTASLLGSAGQANYAAANAFLDALAHERRNQNLPGLSINWGPWAEVGLAAAQADRGKRGEGRGMDSLLPAQGLAALGQLLSAEGGQLGVMRFSPRQWRQSYPQSMRRPFFAELMQPDVDQGAPDNQLTVRIMAAEPGERKALLEAHIQEQVAHVLRLAPSRIDVQTPFNTLGLDSLMALQLRNQLEASLGLTLPATLVWGYPTAAALAIHLAEKIGVSLASPDAARPVKQKDQAAFEKMRADIIELSEDDVLASLLGENQ